MVLPLRGASARRAAAVAAVGLFLLCWGLVHTWFWAKGQLVETFEREYIVDLMKRHKMNLSSAAREAQIDRKHLRELMRKYGLDPRHDPGDDDAQ